jgi:hypothetical protein
MRNTVLSLQQITDAILASCTIVHWTIEMEEILVESLFKCSTTFNLQLQESGINQNFVAAEMENGGNAVHYLGTKTHA